MIDVQLRIRERVRFALLFAGMAFALHASAIERVGRYSAERPGPTIVQRDLLSAPMSMRFPDAIQTVGQAIEAALMTTGYRLSTPLSADPSRAMLLALPLPASHREFSSTSVRYVLQTLVGPAFKLIEDPVHRLVSFERCGRPTESSNSTGAQQ